MVKHQRFSIPVLALLFLWMAPAAMAQDELRGMEPGECSRIASTDSQQGVRVDSNAVTP